MSTYSVQKQGKKTRILATDSSNTRTIVTLDEYETARELTHQLNKLGQDLFRQTTESWLVPELSKLGFRQHEVQPDLGQLRLSAIARRAKINGNWEEKSPYGCVFTLGKILSTIESLPEAVARSIRDELFKVLLQQDGVVVPVTIMSDMYDQDGDSVQVTVNGALWLKDEASKDREWIEESCVDGFDPEACDAAAYFLEPYNEYITLAMAGGFSVEIDTKAAALWLENN